MWDKIKLIYRLLTAKGYYLVTKSEDNSLYRAIEGFNTGDAKCAIDDLFARSEEAIDGESAVSEAKNIISGIG